MNLCSPEFEEAVACIQNPAPECRHAIAVPHTGLETLRNEVAVPFDARQSAPHRQALFIGEQLSDARFLWVYIRRTEQCLVSVRVVIKRGLKLPVEAEWMIERSVRARIVRCDNPACAAD